MTVIGRCQAGGNSALVDGAGPLSWGRPRDVSLIARTVVPLAARYTAPRRLLDCPKTPLDLHSAPPRGGASMQERKKSKAQEESRCNNITKKD